MNTRKDNNGKAIKAWKNLGVGHIAKPLRHIRRRLYGARNANGELIIHADYLKAYHKQRRGDGDYVQRLARRMQ